MSEKRLTKTDLNNALGTLKAVCVCGQQKRKHRLEAAKKVLLYIDALRAENERLMAELRRKDERIRELEAVARNAREFHEAFWKVEEGIVSFGLHNEAVGRLEIAEKRLRESLAALQGGAGNDS